MVYIDSEKNISLTRGDWLPLRLPLKNKNDQSDYIVQDVKNTILQKDFTPVVGESYVDIDLFSDETKIGDYISKTETYGYEVELNPGTQYACTILGVERIKGKDIHKNFYLVPEAGDKDGQ